MKISARNQLKGTISAVSEGAVYGVVAIDLGDATIKADITMELSTISASRRGMTAYAIIKATTSMFAAGTERISSISARNQLAGTVAEVERVPSMAMSL